MLAEYFTEEEGDKILECAMKGSLERSGLDFCKLFLDTLDDLSGGKDLPLIRGIE